MTASTDILLLTLGVVVLVLIAFAAGAATGSWQQRRSAKNRAEQLVDSSDALSEPAVLTPPPARRRAAIVLNPSKHGADAFRGIADAVCREAGWDAPLIIETTVDDPGTAMTEAALEAGVDVVVAAGGDGTVRSVGEVLTGTDVPLGIIPMGTGNLLARNLNIVLDRPEWALRIALWGADSRIDVAFSQLSEDGPEHAYLVMAGLGFDAAVMADTNDALKSRVGWLAYLEAGSRKLSGTRTRVSLRFDDDEPVVSRVRSVLGGNCGKVQGGLMLLPNAKVDDGLLDVLVVTPKNIVQWMGVAAAIIGKRHHGVHTKARQCRSLVVEAEKDIEVQLDGDPFGATSYMTMRIEPSSLTVRTATPELRRRIRTADWPGALGFGANPLS